MNKTKMVGSPAVIMVQDQSGKPLPGIPVFLGTRYACTDMFGEALFLGLENGQYEMRIDTSLFRPVRKKISIKPRLRRHQFILQLSQFGSISGVIRLTCIDFPLPSAHVHLEPLNPDDTGACDLILWTNWEGRYEGRNIPAGQYNYRAEAEGCHPCEGRCRIETEPLTLDIGLDHVPDPVELTVLVQTDDGSPVTKSRVRLLEGMGGPIAAEKEGTGRCLFDRLDRSPFNAPLSAENPFISPNLVVAAEVEGCHTGYAACSLRYEDRCEVTVTCRKISGALGTIIRLTGQEVSPAVVPLDEAIKIEIRGGRKERMLKAVLPHPGQVKVAAGPNPYATYLRVLDSALNCLGQNWNYANSAAEVTVQTAEQYVFIGIGGEAPDTPDLFSGLQVLYQPVIDPYETNNAFEAAYPIRFGETLRPFLFPGNDEDFFLLEVTGPGVLRARLKGSPVSTRVAVLSPDGREMANTWNYANSDIDISCPVYHGGLYRVAVTPTNPASFTLSAGLLRVDFLTAGGVAEDYSPDTAGELPLALGKWTGGALYPGGRHFVYRFSTEMNGLLRLQLWLPGCACSIAVKNDRGKTLYSSWNYANTAITGDIPIQEAGDHFVEVRATDGSGASLINFGLLAHYYPNDEYEGYQGNNSPLKAPEIHFGQKVAGCIAVPGDIDVFSFYADHPGLVTIETSPFPASLALSVTGSGGREVFRQWDYANAKWSREFHVTEAGYYYLQLQCTNPGGYTPAAYTLVLNILRIKPETGSNRRIPELPLNTGVKVDWLLPGGKKDFTLPLSQPGPVKIGLVPPISAALTVTGNSGAQLFNSWNYAGARLQCDLNIDTPGVLAVSARGTNTDLWSRQTCFIYATDGDLPPEPALTIEGIDDDNRKVILGVAANPAQGRSIKKYQMDFEGSGRFITVKPGLNQHTYKEGLFTPVLKVTDDRGAVGLESIFLDLAEVDLGRISCVIHQPKDGQAVSSPGGILARCSNGPGKAVKQMKLFLDGRQVAASPVGHIEYTPNWKALGPGEHTVRVEARSVGGDQAEQTARFRLHEVFNLWPENGAVISGTRASITWFSPSRDETVVDYRKKGEAGWTTAKGARGKDHRVTLEDLEFGPPYEFRAGNGQVLSEIRSFSLFKGLSFERSRYGFTIPRAYGQLMPVAVKNYSEQPMEVVLKCLQPPDDELLAGFVGEGSEDRPVHLGAGEIRQFVLSLSAQDCLKELHRFQVRIGSLNGFSDQAEVEVLVQIPRVDLAWEVIESNPSTLSQRLRLINRGDSLTDLSVRVNPEDSFRLRPKVEHTLLEAGSSLELWVDPVLFDGFERAEGDLAAESIGKTFTCRICCAVPEGQEVYRVTVDPTYMELISSWYCTNRPELAIILKSLGYLEKSLIGEKIQSLSVQEMLLGDFARWLTVLQRAFEEEAYSRKLIKHLAREVMGRLYLEFPRELSHFLEFTGQLEWFRQVMKEPGALEPEVSGLHPLVLSKRVGAGADNNAADVLALKRRLLELGFFWIKVYDDPKDAEKNGRMDEETIKALRLFQGIIGGKVDGVVDVMGKTHKWLQAQNAPHWYEFPLLHPRRPYGGADLYNFDKWLGFHFDDDDNFRWGTNWMRDVLSDVTEDYVKNHFGPAVVKRFLDINWQTLKVFPPNIEHIGKLFDISLPPPPVAAITVNDISEIYGKSRGHASHNTGMSCDLRLPCKNGQAPGGITHKSSSYDRETTRAILKALRNHPLVDKDKIYFNDPVLIKEGLCNPKPKHHDHIHFTIKPPPPADQ